MGSINDNSDNDFLVLVKELKSQENYLDKVKFFYVKNERYKGEKRTIMNIEYSFSLLPQTQEEKLIWWKYFVEQRALEYCKFWMDKNASEMDSVDDRTRTIEVLSNDIQDEVNSNKDRIWGYKYGIKKTGLDSLNLESFEVESFMSEIGKGLGLYYADLELKKLQEGNIEDDSILNIESKLDRRHKLALIENLGILEHLSSRYNIVNEPIKLVRLVAEILGVDISNGKNKSFVTDVNYLIRGNESKGPNTNKAKKTIQGFLHSIGLTRADLSPKINERTRR